MNITSLLWSNIVIKHKDKSFEDKKIKCASLALDNGSLNIVPYSSCQGSTTGGSMWFPKAKLLELNSWSIKFSAEYFSYSFSTKETKTHDVIVSADF
jgi:hypothetical protein